MNTTLAQAIQAQFALIPNLQALTASGKLWHIEADYDELLPYVTFFTASAPRELTTGSPFVTNFTVQWSFHAASADAAQALAQAFMQASPNGFDRAPLQLGNDLVGVAQFEDDGQTTIGEGKGPGGKDCFVHIVTYQVYRPTSRT